MPGLSFCDKLHALSLQDTLHEAYSHRNQPINNLKAQNNFKITINIPFAYNDRNKKMTRLDLYKANESKRLRQYLT